MPVKVEISKLIVTIDFQKEIAQNMHPPYTVQNCRTPPPTHS